MLRVAAALFRQCSASLGVPAHTRGRDPPVTAAAIRRQSRALRAASAYDHLPDHHHQPPPSLPTCVPSPPAHSSPTVKMRGNFKVMRRRSQFRLSLPAGGMHGERETGGSCQRPPSASERMLIINLQGDAGGRGGRGGSDSCANNFAFQSPRTSSLCAVYT